MPEFAPEPITSAGAAPSSLSSTRTFIVNNIPVLFSKSAVTALTTSIANDICVPALIVSVPVFIEPCVIAEVIGTRVST